MGLIRETAVILCLSALLGMVIAMLVFPDNSVDIAIAVIVGAALYLLIVVPTLVIRRATRAQEIDWTSFKDAP